MTAQIVFWLAALAPIYTFALYPAVLLVLRCIIRRDVKKEPIEPFVSLLIPAFNEAAAMERKIRNSLELLYPRDRLEIVVACDGSKDETPAIAQRLADGQRVRALVFPVNRGKVATLNAGVPQLRGEIVVFSDATAILRPDSLRRLVANFADPGVGAASGLYRVVKPDDVSIGSSEDLYWRYESFLKVQESQLGSTLGGHGHLHAIRRALYPYPPSGTINDDYVIPMSVLRNGFRAVYEPDAMVYEEAREMTGFGRRIRIMAGNIQQLREIRGLLFPTHPLELFFFVSHKLCRLLVPFAMVAAFSANLFLAGSPGYTTILALQTGFYLIALCGIRWRLRPKALMLPFYFSMINASTFFGLYHALTRRRALAWK